MTSSFEQSTLPVLTRLAVRAAPVPPFSLQYFLQHPDQLFGRPVERAMVDARNPSVLGKPTLLVEVALPAVHCCQDHFPQFLLPSCKHTPPCSCACRIKHLSLNRALPCRGTPGVCRGRGAAAAGRGPRVLWARWG